MPTLTIEQAIQTAAQYQRSGNPAAGEALCRQILAVVPQHRDALHLLGMCVLSAGRNEEALQCFTLAAAQFPLSADYQCDAGVVHRFLGQTEEAVLAFEKALKVDPNHPVAWSNLSDTLLRLGRIDEAIAAGQRAVAAKPTLVEGHSNLGNALRDARRLDEAVEHFHRAIALDPNFAQVHNNLAYAYIEMDRWDDAIASCDRALALQPSFYKAYLNRGTACMGKVDIAQAQECFRRGVAGEPDYADAHWNLSLALLIDGKYEDGWREFEWRNRSSIRRYLGGLQSSAGKPQWDGSPAEGQTLLVYPEQGVGDVIQFARYLPFVQERSRAARVIFLCPPPIAELLERSGGWNAEIVPHRSDDESSLPDFDQHVALLSLPLTLQRFEPLPVTGPYLRADEQKQAKWRERIGTNGRRKIGLVWRGNPNHVDDRHRSIEPRLFQPLFEVPGVEIYSLQIDMGGSKTGGDLKGLIDLTSHIADFSDTAAFMAELDLIISVDTATAHLAGALGVPVWTLLAFSPDWRWGTSGESTPWYPTMRLFRLQTTTEPWEVVIQRITAELAAG
jgi:tetratricopeptide (TPR) repeat protein